MAKQKTPVNPVLSARIKETRMRIKNGSKMTQSELAEKIGVEDQTIRKYENGKSGIPKVSVAAIAREFGCCMDRQGIIDTFLGKQVHVTVDRPMGHVHKGMVYPINYGFLPGVTAGDGEEQDVYILGIHEPIASFDGRIIGVVRRLDDSEDKLVAAPEGVFFHQGQIGEAVSFQERYFDSRIEALFHKSCGVVPYRFLDSQLQILILKQSSGFWSFPKGHMEPWESEEETALREFREEAGTELRLLSSHRETITYPLSPISWKELTLFAGEVLGTIQTPPDEILQHKWVPLEALSSYLLPTTLDTSRRLLAEAGILGSF